MKRATILIILVCLFSVNYGQRKIKKVEVTENGFNVRISYNPVVDEILYDNVKLKITPISPDKLNTLFINENSFNGTFEYSHYEDSREAYFLKRKRIRKMEKSDLQFFIEGSEWLIENDKINEQEYNELIKQIIYYFDEEEAEETYSLNKFITANPYYIGGNYLNLFQVEFSNPSNSTRIFSDEISIEIGSQLLNPLKKEEIIHLLDLKDLNSSFKEQTLERNHFSNYLIIPPNSTFIKYFATLPIDYLNDNLLISIFENATKGHWEISRDEKIIDKIFTFFEFNVDYSFDGFTSDNGTNFNVIVNPSPTVFLDDDLLFIDENQLEKEIEILTLSIYSDKLHYGRSIIKGKDLVNLEKYKRSTQKLELIEIDELKKKVKVKL